MLDEKRIECEKKSGFFPKFAPFLATFLLAVAAGIFIGIGGTVLLSLENRVIGSVMFSIALLSICMMGLYLFTGKVGYLVVNHDGADILALLCGLVGNGVGCYLTAEAIRICRPELIETCWPMVLKKLQVSSLSQTFLAAVFCGILMFTAVQIFKTKQSLSGIFFCVPVFILSGFEHSIADMFYFFLVRAQIIGEYAPFTWAVLIVVVLGNTVGGCIMPLLLRLSARLNGTLNR